MSMKQTLTAATICALALAFNASANVAYDNEVTNEWFSVDVSQQDLTQDPPWKAPKKGGTAVVDQTSGKIQLDTDLDDQLTYTPSSNSGDLAIVTAHFTATANTADPVLESTPQAALTVIVEGADTNWCGLVNGISGNEWVKFSNEIPTVGNEYKVQIEFDLRQSQKRIRYSVGGRVLRDAGSADGWYGNPNTAATAIASVSFAGTGDIGDFGGDNVVAAEAGFNGRNYATFADALAAAKTAGGTTPVVLYKDVTYAAPGTDMIETIYVNANGHEFTITGGVAVDQDGNTYTITKGEACEAKIGTVFYSTIEKAITEAEMGATILVNKAINKVLTFNNTSVTLDTNGKTVTCATLTVANGVTLSLANALAVTDAAIAGSVAGSAALTVNGTLTGVDVANLVFGNEAIFAYGGTPLAAATLGTALRVTGLSQAVLGTAVIASGVTGSTAFTSDLPSGKCLEVNKDGALKVASVVEIDDPDNVEGYDYTNGTVNVETTLKDGTGTAVLTVVDFQTGVETSYEKDLASGVSELSWDLTGLVSGGAYTYTVDVKVGSTTVATKTGEFTAAKWGGDGDWFYADTSKDPDVYGGTWAAEPPVDSDGRYVVEDAQFEVTSVAGSNKFTRVDTKVSFESLVDGAPDAVSDAIGGFVATTEGWKALGADGWVALSGGVAPAVNVEYVIRAEFDFPQQRVRFFVSADDGAGFEVLSNETSGEWITLAKEQETLQSVGFQGSGLLASINATVASKALAVVGGVKYDSMADALAAAQRTGAAIELLTNATIEPDRNTPGKYAIVVPSGYEYMSGGKVSRESKTIIVEGTGKPPVVRLNDSEMRNVRVPGVNASVQSVEKLRKFLEDSKIAAYTDDDASATRITEELKTSDEVNGLKYWQDYALGIVVGTSVDPVTTPEGDTDAANITLAIPAVKKANYSGDYTIKYQVTDGGEPVDATDPSLIKIPLDRPTGTPTGTYTIKVLFTPVD